MVTGMRPQVVRNGRCIEIVYLLKHSRIIHFYLKKYKNHFYYRHNNISSLWIHIDLEHIAEEYF